MIKSNQEVLFPTNLMENKALMYIKTAFYRGVITPKGDLCKSTC